VLDCNQESELSEGCIVIVSGSLTAREATFRRVPVVGEQIVLDPAGPNYEVFRVVHFAEGVEALGLQAKPAIHVRIAKPDA
jgi:hypothetical protein